MSANHIGIRPAKIDDAPAIAILLEQLEYPDTAAFIQTRLRTLLDHPDENLLVWEEQGQVLAFISLHFIPQIALPGDFARISYFAVADRARSRGIGEAMENHCETLARARNCALMEVHCHTRRERAHAFYYRQGYSESPKYLIKRL